MSVQALKGDGVARREGEIFRLIVKVGICWVSIMSVRRCGGLGLRDVPGNKVRCRDWVGI